MTTINSAMELIESDSEDDFKSKQVTIGPHKEHFKGKLTKSEFDEDVPSDFFDDFSNDEFMDGLDMVESGDDVCEDDEGLRIVKQNKMASRIGFRKGNRPHFKRHRSRSFSLSSVESYGEQSRSLEHWHRERNRGYRGFRRRGYSGPRRGGFIPNYRGRYTWYKRGYKFPDGYRGPRARGYTRGYVWPRRGGYIGSKSEDYVDLRSENYSESESEGNAELKLEDYTTPRSEEYVDLDSEDYAGSESDDYTILKSRDFPESQLEGSTKPKSDEYKELQSEHCSPSKLGGFTGSKSKDYAKLKFGHTGSKSEEYVNPKLEGDTRSSSGTAGSKFKAYTGSRLRYTGLKSEYTGSMSKGYMESKSGDFPDPKSEDYTKSSYSEIQSGRYNKSKSKGSNFQGYTETKSEGHTDPKSKEQTSLKSEGYTKSKSGYTGPKSEGYTGPKSEDYIGSESDSYTELKSEGFSKSSSGYTGIKYGMYTGSKSKGYKGKKFESYTKSKSGYTGPKWQGYTGPKTERYTRYKSESYTGSKDGYSGRDSAKRGFLKNLSDINTEIDDFEINKGDDVGKDDLGTFERHKHQKSPHLSKTRNRRSQSPIHVKSRSPLTVRYMSTSPEMKRSSLERRKSHQSSKHAHNLTGKPRKRSSSKVKTESDSKRHREKAREKSSKESLSRRLQDHSRRVDFLEELATKLEKMEKNKYYKKVLQIMGEGEPSSDAESTSDRKSNFNPAPLNYPHSSNYHPSHSGFPYNYSHSNYHLTPDFDPNRPHSHTYHSSFSSEPTPNPSQMHIPVVEPGPYFPQRKEPSPPFGNNFVEDQQFPMNYPSASIPHNPDEDRRREASRVQCEPSTSTGRSRGNEFRSTKTSSDLRQDLQKEKEEFFKIFENKNTNVQVYQNLNEEYTEPMDVHKGKRERSEVVGTLPLEIHKKRKIESRRKHETTRRLLVGKAKQDGFRMPRNMNPDRPHAGRSCYRIEFDDDMDDHQQNNFMSAPYEDPW